VFIIGHLGGKPRRKVFPITRSSGQALTELTQGLADAYRVYDPAGVARTLKAEAGGVGAKTGLYAVPVLTPDRLEKRQNGRRFKKPGEPMFTLTAQDRHGVLVGKGEQYGETEEGNAVKILRELREEIGEKAFAEWGLGILNSLQSEEVLQQGVHGERIQRREEERKLELDRGSQESTGVSEKDGMLKMRKQREFRYPPQGRRLPEQLRRELSCIVQELSYKGAPQEGFLQSLWTASEGIGVLREALSTVQEAWAPSGNKEAKRAYRIRRLTPLETFRLQGFPDEFFHRAKAAGVSDSQLYKQAGNAVTVNVVYEIAKRLG
jgi:DNA (cytosine-5)-methyltransferase 1